MQNLRRKVKEKMKIDCLVCDLDGTLLNSQKKIGERTVHMLKSLQKQGIRIILATGRNDVYVKNLARQIDLKGCIIACNGALVRNIGTKETVFSKSLDKADVKRIVEYCLVKKYEFVLNGENSMICSAENERIKIYQDYNKSVPLEDKLPISIFDGFDELQNCRIYRIFICPIVHETAKKFMQVFASNRDICFQISENAGLDIMANHVGKERALKVLLDYYEVPTDRVAAFGDYYNDKKMLQLVKYSFSMENAVDEIKNISRYVTKSNDEDGIAYAIKKYLK